MTDGIALEGVRKSYGPVTALHRLDLAIAPGQTTVLIGPSGSGKSTVLRLIVGLERPDAGLVRLPDGPLDPRRARAARLRMGYVIQEGGLFPHLTARENVALLPRHLGWRRDRVEARLRVLAELARLPLAALDRHPGELSGGQRQRVSLMRALALDPEILLLDEPLGALDPMIRRELQDDLREIFGALGKTVVLVTHDLSEAAFFGDRLVLFREGRVVQAGALDALLATPADPFVERFVRAQRPPVGLGGA